MTVETITWRRSALGDLSAANVAGVLGSFNTLFIAEKAANPSTWQWEVADYSAVNGTLVLKPRSGTQRLMLFGGSSPNSAAIDSAAAATTTTYVGLATAPGVDAPQQAYTAGAPFTTGEWIPGGSMAGNSALSGFTKVEYWEHEDGLVLVVRSNTMNSGAGNLTLCWGGIMAVTVDGNTGISICGGPAGELSSNMDTVTTSGASSVPFSNGVTGTSSARNNFYDADNDVVRRCEVLFKFRTTGLDLKMRDAGNRRYFAPIFMVNSNEDRLLIKMRQMSWGISEAHGTTYSDVDGVQGHRIAFRADQASVGFWLSNKLV